MVKRKSIFVLTDEFLKKAQERNEYIDINSAAIYSDAFIEDFVRAVSDKECDDYSSEAVDRMTTILKEEQFNYDFIDEDGKLYGDAFIKNFKRKYLLLMKRDIVKRLS